MSKLILVRHGESEFNAKGLWTGWLDPKLSDKGKKHAEAIAKKLKDHKITKAYTSDLTRAQDTWEIIHEYITDGKKRVPTKGHKHLNERHYGKFAGKNKWQVKDEVGEDVFMKIRRSWDYAPERGESLKDVHDRVVPYYEQEILPKIKNGDVVITVTHGNTNRALIKHLENIGDGKISEVEMPHEMVVIYHFKDGKLDRKEVIEVDI